MPAQPFQQHRSMLRFIIPIVQQGRSEFLILAGLGSLLVPIDLLQLLHQCRDRAVPIEGFRSQDGPFLVQ
jgi:hypothetical protein